MDWDQIGIIYVGVSITIGILGAIAVFLSLWVLATAEWGLGAFLFGWLPSGVAAFLAFWITSILWPLGVVVLLFYLARKSLRSLPTVQIDFTPSAGESPVASVRSFIKETPPQARREWKIIWQFVLGVAGICSVLMLAQKMFGQ